MRDHARTVIVGSGAAGNALAAALARMGDTDVIVLDARADRSDRDVATERFGAILASHPSSVISRLVRASLPTFADLATDEPSVWQRTGSLEVATTVERLDLLRRRAEALGAEGIGAEVLDPDGAAAHVPSLDPAAILGALHIPSDGVADRAAFAAALARRASAAGATFASGARVTGIEVRDGRVTGVITDSGPFACERLVLASCRDSARIAALVGVDLPVFPVTRPIRLSGALPEAVTFPVVRHPDAGLTLRRRDDRLVVAGHGYPAGWTPAATQLLPALAGSLAGLAEVDPDVEATVTVTPDGMPITGPHGGLAGLWVLAGARLALIPALADALAARLCDGDPSAGQGDLLSHFDPNRWYPFEAVVAVAAPRATAMAASSHELAPPTMDELPPRSLRLSPFHRREEELGAIWTAVAGWEVPSGYRKNQEEEANVEAEVAAVLERVGLIDRTSAAKFDVWGEGAAGLLRRTFGDAADNPVGVLTEMPMNPGDGAPTTRVVIVRKSPDLFRLVTDARSGQRLFALLRSQVERSPEADVSERTGSLFAIRLVGPRAEELLVRATGADVSRGAFPPSTARYMEIGPVVPVWAHRFAASERADGADPAGWDLFGQFAMGERAWDLLMAAGEDFGVSPVGTDAASLLGIG